MALFLILACNNESVPRTFKEICAVSNSSKKEIGRWFKAIKKHIDSSNYTTTSPTDLIVKKNAFLELNFCEDLKINYESFICIDISDTFLFETQSATYRSQAGWTSARTSTKCELDKRTESSHIGFGSHLPSRHAYCKYAYDWGY